MKRGVAAVVSLVITLTGLTGGCSHEYIDCGEPAPNPRPFAAYDGLDATFVMLDFSRGTIIEHNAERADERFSPCSTFKIPHSIFALDAGVLKDDKEVLKWDGVTRDREALNRDHDLRGAISVSVVWYYQELARRLGMEREQKYLDSISYGNRDTSAGLTEFWLNTSLAISAREQVAFLDRFRRSDLPFSQRSMDIVKDCLIVRNEPGLVYRGKTGSGRGNGSTPDIGWWVGWVERDGRAYVFAANVSGHDMWGPRVRELTEQVLIAHGVLPPVQKTTSR